MSWLHSACGAMKSNGQRSSLVLVYTLLARVAVTATFSANSGCSGQVQQQVLLRISSAVPARLDGCLTGVYDPDPGLVEHRLMPPAELHILRQSSNGGLVVPVLH